MARRRNSVTKRFAKMRGLPPEEKALMQRLGNLIDAALNNRQASNPFEQSQARANRLVYPPTGLLTQTGVSSVKLIWNATPSDQLLRYEIEFINLTTGLHETETSFTNEITYKGADGSYLARIKSVGRDGSSSEIRQVSFGIGGDVMLLEGAKNGPAELGQLVQDNILLREGYSIYAWGSCVLDKFMLDTNPNIVFKLWRAERADALFGEASLVETITLYPGTESGTDLDSTARAGLITRPTTVRTGSFETSQSVMFSPQRITSAADDDKTVTYFLQAVNREVEDDEVCLSLVLWSGADGIGTAVPGQGAHIPKAPYIHPHFNSFHMQGAPNGVWQGNFPYDTRCLSANVDDSYSLIGNHWSIAMWVRFDNLSSVNLASGAGGPDDDSGTGTVDGGTQHLISRHTIATNNKTGPNKFRFFIDGTIAPAQHVLNCFIHDWRAENGGNPHDGKDSRWIQYKAASFGPRSEQSAIFRWGDAVTTRDDEKNNAWYFMVMCFEGGDFVGPVPKFRLYMNVGLVETTEGVLEPAMQLMVPTSDESKDPVTQNDAGNLAYVMGVPAEQSFNHTYELGFYSGDIQSSLVSAGAQYHRIGIWNVALDYGIDGPASDMGAIHVLFNRGRGWNVDWRRNGQSTFLKEVVHYPYAENLVHLNQLGAVEEWFQTKQAGRDMGWHLPGLKGELSWTSDVSDLGKEWQDIDAGVNYHKRLLLDANGGGVHYDNLPQSWHRGTDIYDILSPTEEGGVSGDVGTNNTTQYDFAYPGQNQSGQGSISQGNAYWYPKFADWVEAGSDLSILPWLSAPYPPGYHKDDPDRPHRGGGGGGL